MIKFKTFIHLLYILFFLFIFACCVKDNNDQSTDEIPSLDTAKPLTIVDSTERKNIPKIKPGEDLLNYMKRSGDWDKYRDGILVRMCEENSDYAQKLLHNTHDYFIVVDKGSMRVILYDRFGRKRMQYKMACGKNYGTKREKADSRTPEGFFTAQGVYDSTDWLFTDDNGKKSNKKGQFGPRFIRLRIPTTSQIGIHGTCAPWSVGNRCSHGCIRITNEQIMELVEYVEIGMPIIVNPGKKDILVNQEEGNNISWITIDNRPIKVPLPEKNRIDTILTDSANIDSIQVENQQNYGNKNDIDTICDSMR